MDTLSTTGSTGSRDYRRPCFRATCFESSALPRSTSRTPIFYCDVESRPDYRIFAGCTACGSVQVVFGSAVSVYVPEKWTDGRLPADVKLVCRNEGKL
ncbi:hypothetical protein FKP32DRAFT_585177 [Trametes sanguinea]|nr:hypothetical protein FKP32DRAFT_585177 [Trametes sanguinea]